ncbi:MAG: imidazolonepropionase [Candidatus Neomarinimicrobiota bacterium]
MKPLTIDNFILKNIGELVTFDKQSGSMQVYRNVEMVFKSGTIAAVGKDLDSPEFTRIDARGGLITPGFVDAHTHPVFNATREQEFEMRVMGKSYQEIARAGGGILASVRSMQEIGRTALTGKVRARLDGFLRQGTTTIEAKSGYALTLEGEIDSLRLLKRLALKHPLDIRTTFMGAHDYPEAYQSNHTAYLDLLIEKMLPQVVREGLADFCDVFCEEGVFSVAESRRVLEAAKFLGLGLRIHADEFKPIGGVRLANKLGAVSADHLTAITEEGIEALIAGKIVPVLLPATTFFLGSDHYAPGRRLWDAGLPVAVATDFNPGSAMTQSMALVITLACLKMHLHPLEALQAATYNAACSLKMERSVGSLEPSKQADFSIWKFSNYQGIPYFLGFPALASVWKRGRKVWNDARPI